MSSIIYLDGFKESFTEVSVTCEKCQSDLKLVVVDSFYDLQCPSCESKEFEEKEETPEGLLRFRVNERVGLGDK